MYYCYHTQILEPSSSSTAYPIPSKEVPPYAAVASAKKLPKQEYTGMILCASKTDKLCPFSYGVVYLVKNGKLTDEKGNVLSGFTNIQQIREKTGIDWQEVSRLENQYTYYTGFIFCKSCFDFHTFKPGHIYGVVNGGIHNNYIHFFAKESGSEAFCHALSREFPGIFIPVKGVQELTE